MVTPQKRSIPATAEQLAAFIEGVAAIGGPRAAARALDMNERSLIRLQSGELPLYCRHCDDLATALRVHARHAFGVASMLSPSPLQGGAGDGDGPWVDEVDTFECRDIIMLGSRAAYSTKTGGELDAASYRAGLSLKTGDAD